MANTISVNVVADVKNIRKGIDNVNSQLSGFQKTAGKVGSALKGMFAGAAVLAGGGAIVGVFKDSIGAASDFNETVSKTQTIFGTASGDMLAFGKTAAKSLGMSNEEALAGVSTFGNFFNQIGIGNKVSADMSKGFVQMATDLGSFNNAAPVEVMDALASATRGEYDALQKYIPTINAAAVQNKAMAMTGKDNVKALTDAEKATALYTLAQEGQGKAAGDFARTQGGLANQQRILSAQWADAKVTMGNVLLPIITKFVTFLNTSALPAVKQMAGFFKENLWPAMQDIGSILSATVVPAFKALVGFFSANTGVLLAFVAGFTALFVVMQAHSAFLAVQAVGGLVAYISQMGIVQTATKAWAAVQWVLNAALSANPIALVVIAIAALIAIFVLAWKNSETFQKVVTAAWEAIKKATSAVWDFVKNLLEKTWNWIKSAGSSVFNAVKSVITGVWNAIKSATSATWNAIRSAIETAINAVKTIVSTVFEVIKTVITTYFNAYKAVITTVLNVIKTVITTVFNVYKTVITGVWNAISSATSAAWNAIKSAISAVTGWISGAATAVFNGFKSAVSGVWNSVKSITSSAWNGIKSAVSTGVTGVVNYVKSLPGNVVRGLGNIGSLLYNSGRQMLQGMVNGLKSMASNLASAALAPVKAAVDKVKGFLGINSPSRLFKQLGKDTNAGLVIGLKDVAGVKKAASGMADAVARGFSAPELEMSSKAFTPGAPGNGHGAAVINVTVNAPVGSSPEEIGRTLVDAIKSYETVGGTRWRAA